jgi:chromosome segregation ATPase
MNFEAVARWNEQRAEIERLTHLVSEYESRRALNLTDLATLQAELRSAAQENRRLQERCEWLARMERQQRWRALLAEMRIETTAAAHYQDI